MTAARDRAPCDRSATRRRWALVLGVLAAGMAAPGPLSAQTGAAEALRGPPLVNQAGYNLGESKRFVVPGAADGTPFVVRRHLPPALGQVAERVGEVVYRGTVRGQAGELGVFDPVSADDGYLIEVEGHGRSHPFWVGDHLMERLSSRLAYQFFADVRGAADLDRFDPARVAGGGPSRDGGAYTLEATFESLLYASNPALFDRWTAELGSPATPDLIDLILWHAEFAYRFREYNGPTGHRPYLVGYRGGTMQTYDYQNTLDQLAAVVGSYHSFLRPHLDEATYRRYRQLCLERWEAYDRHRVVRHWVKSDKWIDEGWQEFSEMGNAYGQSVFRNLFMYLAEREERDGDPDRFLGYAREAALDIVRNWNLDDPRHTWLARNAEHVTPQALAFFLLVAPEHAPPGTREKLAAWRDYVVRRTGNLWQYRTHSDAEWAHPRSKEVGTVAGLGGSAFAVAHLLGDPRLRALGWSQVDFVFGVNPVGAHLSHRSVERVAMGGYWPGVERGWPDLFGAGAGRLGEVRGALDGSPLDPAFPYAPERFRGSTDGAFWATEGWAVTNRAWMSTVAFSTLATHAVRALDPRTGQAISRAAPGDSVRVELRAALNANYGNPADPHGEADAVESGWVDVRVNGDSAGRVPVRETGANTGRFAATVHLVPGAPTRPTELRVAPGDEIEISYGYLAFRKSARVRIQRR